MSKLTDLNILVLQDDEKIHFRTPVNVTKEGIFTTTLPNEAYNAIGAYGLNLRVNRLGKPGYFEDKTLDGLRKQIEDVVRDALSKELVEDKIVIKYQIRTRAAYVVDEDGEIIPNGYWCKDHRSFEENRAVWHDGNDNFPGQNFTPSLMVYAIPFWKKHYVYKSGKEYVKYMRYEKKGKSNSSVDWLASQVNVVPDDRTYAPKKIDLLPEVDATEENAAILKKMVMLINTANELFTGLNEPVNLIELAKRSMLPELPEIFQNK